MTITPYNSNNSLAPEFIWTSFDMDEPWLLMNSLTFRLRLKKDLYLWSKFCLGPKIQTEDRHYPESASKITADPLSTVFSKSANPLDLPQKSTIHAFFKAKSIDPKTYSPPSNKDLGLNFVWRWCRSFQSWYSLKEKAIIFQQRQVIKLTELNSSNECKQAHKFVLFCCWCSCSCCFWSCCFWNLL